MQDHLPLVCFQASCSSALRETRPSPREGRSPASTAWPWTGAAGPVSVTPAQAAGPLAGRETPSSGLVCRPRSAASLCGLRVQSPGRLWSPGLGERRAGSVRGGGSLLTSERILQQGHTTLSLSSLHAGPAIEGETHTLTPEGGGSRSLTRHCVSVIK